MCFFSIHHPCAQLKQSVSIGVFYILEVKHTSLKARIIDILKYAQGIFCILLLFKGVNKSKRITKRLEEVCNSFTTYSYTQCYTPSAVLVIAAKIPPIIGPMMGTVKPYFQLELPLLGMNATA